MMDKRFFIAYNFETFQGKTGTATTRMTLPKYDPKAISSILKDDNGYKHVTIQKVQELTEPNYGMLADSEIPIASAPNWDALKPPHQKKPFSKKKKALP